MQCRQRFATETLLEHHYNMVHFRSARPVRAIYCNVCGAEFANQRELQLHRSQQQHFYVPPPPPSPASAHSGVPRSSVPGMFPCPRCGHLFSVEANRDSHLALQHPPAVSQPQYTCEVCGEEFTNRLVFLRHISLCEAGSLGR